MAYRMGYRIGDELVEIEAKVKFVTQKAYLIEPTLGDECWLPKSCVMERTEQDPDGNVVFQVLEWWAKKNGFI